MLCFGILLMVCQEPKPPPAPPGARFCQIAQPFRWSAKDTAESRRQAKAWNAAGVRVCGWKPPGKAKK